MADVMCTNEACPEYELPKTNEEDFPVADIRCGGCGGPVSAAGEEPPPEEDQPEVDNSLPEPEASP